MQLISFSCLRFRLSFEPRAALHRIHSLTHTEKKKMFSLALSEKCIYFLLFVFLHCVPSYIMLGAFNTFMINVCDVCIQIWFQPQVWHVRIGKYTYRDSINAWMHVHYYYHLVWKVSHYYKVDEEEDISW